MRKLKNFVSNTSNHQQELTDMKPKRNTSHHKVDSVSKKIAMVMQSKYYNSPSSLIASAQQTHVPNTRVHSGYRRSEPSSGSHSKHGSNSHKPVKEQSRIQNMKADSFIKNSKSNMKMKERKSENLRKLKARPQANNSSSKNSSKSTYIKGSGSNVVSLKGSQNLFAYNVNMKPNDGDDNFDLGQSAPNIK